MLAGRRVVLAVSGGVAAYKAAYLARRLVERDAAVRTVMTKSAARFLGPATLAAITGEQPVTEFFADADVSPHTSLARWAEAIVVAPATASTLARITYGLSEDVLTATVLASTAPVLLAPAMHTEMWEHPATQRNVASLRADGYQLIGPASGALAGGDTGVGRLTDPDEIIDAVDRILGPADLAGWNVLVSAGGTREALDPVRYIGNRSSGKMGNAIALAAHQRGAAVTLVTSAPAPSGEGLEVISVETADDMAEAVWERAAKTDVVVLAAAVADFRPKAPDSQKLRRADGLPQITLTATPDILAGVSAMEPRPFLVGFAAEIGGVEGAIEKARSKGVDLLVANDVAAAGSGFGSDTNEVTLITPSGVTEAWPSLPKREVADRLWDHIATIRGAQT